MTAVYVGNHYEVKNSVVTKYYFAGATRIAVRTGGTLSYLLGDHLGSSSLTTDANGLNTVTALYKAFGETRYSSGNLGTDYKFTGQREEAALGIYFFNARWMDPYLNRFTQPDSIVPDPYNSQDWDRYSYARNNPIRYNDPSGHRACDYEDENGNCITLTSTDYIELYKKELKNRYGWNMKGNWSLREIEAAFQTANDIESYVNSITGGNGRKWMQKYMGGINISISNGNRGKSLPGNILLPKWWNGNSTFDKYYFAHELAHSWDTNTGRLGILGIVDGPADYLNDFIGGDVSGSWSCRFCDGSGSNHIPNGYLFSSGVMTDQNGSPYGNNSTADYAAESFALNLYYPEGGHVNSTVTLWINTFISLQASNLP